MGRGETVAVPGRPDSRALLCGPRDAEKHERFCPLFSAFGPEPVFQRLSRGEARVLLTTEAPIPAKGPAAAGGPSPPDPRPAGGLRRSPGTWRVVPCAAHGGVFGGLHHSADRPRRPGPAALHQRYHRTAQGRHPRPQRRADPLPDGKVRPGFSPRGRLLVHRRPRLGDGHLIRDHRPAAARDHQHHRRSGFRRPALVPDSGRPESNRLVHGAHCHSTAHAAGGRSRGGSTISPTCGSSTAWASPSTRRRWSGARRPSAFPSTTIGGRPRRAVS